MRGASGKRGEENESGNEYNEHPRRTHIVHRLLRNPLYIALAKMSPRYSFAEFYVKQFFSLELLVDLNA
jgi:hypothetical protein